MSFGRLSWSSLAFLPGQRPFDPEAAARRTLAKTKVLHGLADPRVARRVPRTS